MPLPLLPGGARFPLTIRIDSSSWSSGWAIDTLAECCTVVVPVGPAVELKQEREVLDIDTPVEISLQLSLLLSTLEDSATWIISGFLLSLAFCPSKSLRWWPPCSLFLLAWAKSFFPIILPTSSPQ